MPHRALSELNNGRSRMLAKKTLGKVSLIILTLFAWFGLCYLVGMSPNPIRAVAGSSSSSSSSSSYRKKKNKNTDFDGICRVHQQWTNGGFSPAGTYADRRLHDIVGVAFPHEQWNWSRMLDEAYTAQVNADVLPCRSWQQQGGCQQNTMANPGKCSRDVPQAANTCMRQVLVTQAYRILRDETTRSIYEQEFLPAVDELEKKMLQEWDGFGGGGEAWWQAVILVCRG